MEAVSGLHPPFQPSNPGVKGTDVTLKGLKAQTCTHFDVLNRAIREERQQADSVARASEFLQTYAARYDALGQLVEETELDWRLGDAPELPGTEFDQGQFDWLGEAPLAFAQRHRIRSHVES